MPGSAGPEDRFPPANAENAMTEGNQASRAGVIDPTRDQSNGSRGLAETELDSALQLLVERAQYITGATGTALALPDGEEMVCRASAGSSAPAVGARLQVRSGLTGESISRRQLLRCDNAEIDPRVNLEACRALGIASIVVLPLLRHNGEVCGLFELFSDHPYAFEERDLVALERMADLTLTALDLAEQRQKSVPAPGHRREPNKAVESPRASSVQPAPAIPANIPPPPELANPEFVNPESPEPAGPAGVASVSPQPAPASVPEAMLRVQKCASCGFPVSEGRTLCLDCEKKDRDNHKKDFEKKQREPAPSQIKPEQIEPQEITPPEQGTAADSPADSAAPVPESVPAFLADYGPTPASWMANHVNLLAIVVLILGILVAVVVFR